MSYNSKTNNREYINRSNSNSNKMQTYKNNQHNNINNGENYYDNKNGSSPKQPNDYYNNSQNNINNRDQHYNKNNSGRRIYPNKQYSDKPNNQYSNQRPSSPQDNIFIPDIDQLRQFVRDQSEKFKHDYAIYQETFQKSGSQSPGVQEYTNSGTSSYKSNIYKSNYHNTRGPLMNSSSNCSSSGGQLGRASSPGDCISGNSRMSGPINKSHMSGPGYKLSGSGTQIQPLGKQHGYIRNNSTDEQQYPSIGNSIGVGGTKSLPRNCSGSPVNSVGSISVGNSTLSNGPPSKTQQILSPGARQEPPKKTAAMGAATSGSAVSYKSPTTTRQYSYVTSLSTGNANNSAAASTGSSLACSTTNASTTSSAPASTTTAVNKPSTRPVPQTGGRDERAVVSVTKLAANGGRSHTSSTDLDNGVGGGGHSTSSTSSSSSNGGSSSHNYQQPPEVFFTPDPPASPSSNRSSPKPVILGGGKSAGKK